MNFARSIAQGTRAGSTSCLAFLGVVLLQGCSSGRQKLGEETATDEHLPWTGGSGYFARWANGPPSSPSFFPLMVWMQSPDNAPRFQDVGVNFFTGLWDGPTDVQLTGLASANMPAVCDQSGVWKSHVTDPTIRGWLQVDQPDDAQQQSDGSYAPCIEPSAIVARYSAMVESDSTRPVFMNLGRGAVDGNWVGRGACSGRDDMYPEYARGADVLTFVTYPVNDGLPLSTVGEGVDRLAAISAHEKAVIAAVEASNIHGTATPTPAQIEAEVWLAIVHGASGIQYFCHQLEPSVNETACLDDPTTHDALRAIDEQVTSLAPILNSPSIAAGVTVTTELTTEPAATLDVTVKRDGSSTYVFAVAAGTAAATAHFVVPGLRGPTTAEVLGESRTVDVMDGTFDDTFTPPATHRYRIRP